MHLTTDWTVSDPLYFTFLNRKSNVHNAFQLIPNNIITRLTCFNQRDIHFLWPPGSSYRNHWIFFCSRCNFSLIKVKDYDAPALRCFAATLLCRVTVNELLMTPETHYISKKKILQGLAETNAIHVNRNLSAFTALLLSWKLFNIYFNGFWTFWYNHYLPHRSPLPNVRLLS